MTPEETARELRLLRRLVRQLGPLRAPGPGQPNHWGDASEEPSDDDLRDALEQNVHRLRGVLMDTPDPAARLDPPRRIFLGNGLRSLQDARSLHARLDRALSLLSGIQQGGPEDPEDLARAEEDIRDVVRDLAVALAGTPVRFEDER